jgi:hypothetical protein
MPRTSTKMDTSAVTHEHLRSLTGKKPAELSDVPSAEKSSTVRFSQPLADKPDQEHCNQLGILLSRVKEYWVDGLLNHSIYGQVPISLGKRPFDKAVDAPWKYTVEVSDAPNSAPLDDRDASAIYAETGLLLILGEPGSGKTTTLLDLARTLLKRATDNIKERIPIVVNL